MTRTLMIKRKYTPKAAQASLANPIADMTEYIPRPKPIPQDVEQQNRLADELLAYVFKHNPDNIGTFACQKGFVPYKFKKICNTNEYFKDRYELASWHIGYRIQKQWKAEPYQRAYAERFGSLHMHEWKESQQVETGTQTTGNFTIVHEVLPPNKEVEAKLKAIHDKQEQARRADNSTDSESI